MDPLEPSPELKLRVPDGPTGRFTATRSPGIDAIAAYLPWHFFYEDWGVYVFQPEFFGFVRDVAVLVGLPEPRLAPLAFRQVLWHEWTHFAFEVTATEIEDVTGIGCYRDYSGARYGSATHWSSGPLEEAVAVWREVAFSRGPLLRSMRPKPRGYANAVRILADASPAGYCDWACMSTPGKPRERVIRDLVSVIAGAPVATGRWGETTQSERRQVPVYWVGNARSLSRIGSVKKAFGPPTIRRFEKWARKNGAEILAGAGKGSHRVVKWEGETATYSTSAGILLRPEAEDVAHLFELPNSSAVYQAVTRMRRLVT